MDRVLLLIGAITGLLAVIAGTFAAHALDSQLSMKAQQIFETGVRYHMYHALAIAAISSLGGRVSGRWPAIVVGFFLAGVIIFSGSLYLLAVTGAKWLGMITPIGGVAFLVGWLLLCVVAFKHREVLPKNPPEH